MLGVSPPAQEDGVLGALPTAFAVALLVTGLITGCGTVESLTGPPTLLPAGAAAAPRGGAAPAGIVLALGAPATAVVVDPHTRTLAVAIADPPRLLLSTVDGSATPREVPLPGPAAALALAATGG